jgi:hypothetical protein
MMTADYAAIFAIEAECLAADPAFHVFQGDDETAEYRTTGLVSNTFQLGDAAARLGAVTAFRDLVAQHTNDAYDQTAQ